MPAKHCYGCPNSIGEKIQPIWMTESYKGLMEFVNQSKGCGRHDGEEDPVSRGIRPCCMSEGPVTQDPQNSILYGMKDFTIHKGENFR